MKSTIAKHSWLLVVAASLAFTAATAATVYDDFKTKWRPVQRGYGTALRMVRNRLEISLGPNARSDGDFFGHGLAGTCQLNGDFDLRVSFRLLDWPPHNGVRVSLYLGSMADIENEGIYLWLLLVGVFVIAVVLLLPNGLADLLERLNFRRKAVPADG